VLPLRNYAHYCIIYETVNNGIPTPPSGVTLHFSDGSAALFTYNKTTKTWVFEVGYDAQGNKLLRNGQPDTKNPNTSGAGGGDAQANGFGKYGGRLADIIFQANCVTETIAVDGSMVGWHIGPC